VVHHLSHGLFVRLRGDAVHGALRHGALPRHFAAGGRGGISGGGRRGIDSLAVVERVEAPKLRERIVEGVAERCGARAVSKRGDADARGDAEGGAHAERGEAAAAGRVRRAAALDDGQQGGVLVRGHDSAGVFISRRSRPDRGGASRETTNEAEAVPRRSEFDEERSVAMSRRVALSVRAACGARSRVGEEGRGRARTQTRAKDPKSLLLGCYE
jgi:hypothetical protein